MKGTRELVLKWEWERKINANIHDSLQVKEIIFIWRVVHAPTFAAFTHTGQFFFHLQRSMSHWLKQDRLESLGDDVSLVLFDLEQGGGVITVLWRHRTIAITRLSLLVFRGGGGTSGIVINFRGQGAGLHLPFSMKLKDVHFLMSITPLCNSHRWSRLFSRYFYRNFWNPNRPPSQIIHSNSSHDPNFSSYLFSPMQPNLGSSCAGTQQLFECGTITCFWGKKHSRTVPTNEFIKQQFAPTGFYYPIQTAAMWRQR